MDVSVKSTDARAGTTCISESLDNGSDLRHMLAKEFELLKEFVGLSIDDF